MTSTPVRYTASVETIAPDEHETIAGLEQSCATFSTRPRPITATRCARFTRRATVLPAAPSAFPAASRPNSQGLFARPGRYEAIVRLSTNAGDILDDAIRLPRGLALKVLGVEGDRLPGSEDAQTQDFVMVNAPAFAAPNTKVFLANLTMLAKTTDKAEGAKKVLSSVLRAFEATLETVVGQSALLSTLGGAKPVHPLGATYFSQTPFRFGDYIAKFRFAPTSAIKDFAEETINASGHPDAIREAVNDLLIEQGGAWELGAQLCADLETMPIEDATVLWDEDDSPFRRIAMLEIPPQAAWTEGVSDAAEDALFFAPWHGLAAHRPLGGINRARRDAYRMSGAFRAQFNGCPFAEPRTLSEVPG